MGGRFQCVRQRPQNQNNADIPHRRRGSSSGKTVGRIQDATEKSIQGDHQKKRERDT
jgi:hypothetical protein